MKSLVITSTALCCLFAAETRADQISWVDFSSWHTGSLTQSGLTDSQSLIMDATFSNMVNLRSNGPTSGTGVIDDSAWPFSNNEVSCVGVIAQLGSSSPLTGELLFSFTSSGGLPAGGSIGIFDLENTSSSVRLTGFQGGSEVDVNWTYAPYNTNDADAPDAIWNSSTNTLTGAGGQISTMNNFSFLVSDLQLDSVRMAITAAPGDGISFAVSGATVPTVPDGGTTFALLGLSLIGMVGAKRFGRGINR